MEKLKPCPFCGGEASLKIVPHIPFGNDYTPQCTVTSCAGRLTKKWMSKRSAIEAWNRRASDAEIHFSVNEAFNMFARCPDE